MEAPDETLMLAYQGGDAGAFETLYGRHKGRLYRFMLRSVKSPEQVDELFQDVWMRVVEARGRYEASAKFTTWLYTIAHNRMMDHFRRNSLRAVDSIDDVQEAAEALPVRPGEQPEAQAETREDLRRLAAAIAALPHAQREVFVMSEESGMSVPEIAEATGDNVEAVKSRLRYALKKLREALRDEGAASGR
jgi:RNA polymerase sigma-70 factor (ECF subfamily)